MPLADVHVINTTNKLPSFSDCNCDCQFIKTTGTFQSPGYPSNYPKNANCEILMQAAEGLFVQLDILDFSIEQDGDEEGTCDNDWDTFRVYDGMTENSPLLGEYCGNLIPRQFISSGMYLFVVFKSDYSIREKGYRAEVSFTESRYSIAKGRPTSLSFVDFQKYSSSHSSSTGSQFRIDISFWLAHCKLVSIDTTHLLYVKIHEY